MALTKIVNGNPVLCEQTEEDSIQAEWDDNAPDTLSNTKQRKKKEVNDEALRRFRELFPTLADEREVRLFAQLWSSIAPAARQPTADMQRLIDIWQAASAAREAVESLATVPEVSAYDAVTDPSWPGES